MSDTRRDSWGMIIGWMLLTLYLPYSWLVWVEPLPWNNYHWAWIRMWPILPGFIPTYLAQAILRLPRPSETLGLWLGGGVTLAFLALVCLLARRSRAWMIGTLGVAFVLSCALAGLAWAMYAA